MIVEAQYDAANEELVLRGIDNPAQFPLLNALVRKFQGRQNEDNSVSIPVKPDQLSDRYQTFSRLFDRLSLQLTVTGFAEQFLEEIESAERRFSEFSQKANEIWHAEIDTDELRDFTRALVSLCPGRTFYKRQILSAFHLAFSQNACNFSVPGAGKTSVVYAAYAYLKSLKKNNKKKIDRLLIVGPLSSFKAWEDEYKEIFGNKARSIRISGAVSALERSRFLRGIDPISNDTELILTSYQTLYRNQEDFRVFLERVSLSTMVVLDEAHYVKGQEGEWAKAALGIAPYAKSRVILTGTPAPNGYEDLSNLFRFLYPERNIIGFPVSSLRAMSDGAMSRAVPELKERIQPFFTRIKKSDLNLPPKNEQVVRVPMGETQFRIYRDLEGRIVPNLRRQFENPTMALRVRAKLIRLRQAAANPGLLLRPLCQEDGIFDTNGTGDLNLAEIEVADLIHSFDENCDLERLHVCREIAKRTLKTQGKVLIWSYFLGNLELLRSSFEELAGFVEVLTGSTPVAGQDTEEPPEIGSREEIIDRFHSTPEKAVLIANPQAVGESISLHKACRTAIYFDRDFNAGRFIQSKDRIHRYNPKGGEEVSYFYLVTDQTIDEDIASRLALKEDRLNDLVDSDDIPILTSALNEAGFEDIKQILESYERRKSHQ